MSSFSYLLISIILMLVSILGWVITASQISIFGLGFFTSMACTALVGLYWDNKK